MSLRWSCELAPLANVLLALIPAFSPEEKETETPMVWRIEDGFSRADE